MRSQELICNIRGVRLRHSPTTHVVADVMARQFWCTDYSLALHGWCQKGYCILEFASKAGRARLLTLKHFLGTLPPLYPYAIC
jgi:hypothetical protein